ncbi:MAG: caspase family protein [Methanomicrobiales archaeon]
MSRTLKIIIILTILIIIIGLVGILISENIHNDIYVKLSAPSQKYVYIIGISQYQDDYQGFTLGSKDAVKIKSFLVESAKFKTNNTRLLVDSEAKNAQIKNDLKSYSKAVSPNDLLMIYYSGHGDRIKTSENGKSEYQYILCPYDETSDHANSLSGKEFQSLVKNINAKNLVFIFDSCNSGGMIEDLTANNTFSNRYVILASCEENESSVGDEELGGGVFTYFLLEAFTKPEADRDQDGWISIEEAFIYARPLTIKNCDFFGDSQHPMIFDGNPQVEIELVKLKNS